MHATNAAKLGVAVLAVVFVGACVTTSQPRTASHWVHDHRMQAVMHVLDTDMLASADVDSTVLVAYASPSDELRERRDRAMDEMCDLGRSLAASADEIVELAKSRPMPEADRSAMTAEAWLLADQSMRLVEMASADSAEGVNLAFSEIQATCTSCHTRFREYAGPLSGR